MPRPEPFRITIIPGVNPGKWTKIWAERNPAIPIEVLPVDESDQVTDLVEGRADMSFVRLPVDSEILHSIRLYDEVTVVVAERDHPIAAYDSVTTADIADEKLLPQSLADAVDLVVAGVGIKVVPQSIARHFSRRDLVMREVSDAPQVTVALVWLRDPPTNSATASDSIEQFIGIVRGRSASSSRGR